MRYFIQINSDKLYVTRVDVGETNVVDVEGYPNYITQHEAQALYQQVIDAVQGGMVRVRFFRTDGRVEATKSVRIEQLTMTRVFSK